MDEKLRYFACSFHEIWLDFFFMPNEAAFGADLGKCDLHSLPVGWPGLLTQDAQFVQFCWLNCGMRFVLFSWELLLLQKICFKLHSLRYMVFTVFSYSTFKKKKSFSSIKCFEKSVFKTDWNWGSATLQWLSFISLNSSGHWDSVPKRLVRNKDIF